jgi:hypothetical protein
MERKRRLWWVWVPLAVLVVASAVAAVALVNGGAYAFLDKFHPQRFPARIPEYSMASTSPTAKRPDRPEMSLLKFAPEDAPKVLAAVKAELVRRGFHSQILTPGRSETGEAWEFEKSVGSAGRPKGIVDMEEGAIFGSGEVGALVETVYAPASQHPMAGKRSCVLLIYHKRNWLENAAQSVRDFFHF